MTFSLDSVDMYMKLVKFCDKLEKYAEVVTEGSQSDSFERNSLPLKR